MHRIIITIILFCLSWTIPAQTLSPTATVELLTCGPGEELYARYGHTAIRINDPEQGIDWTFNYGLFDFNTEGFYLKFIQGYTYYLLGAEPTESFMAQYRYEQRPVYSQTLRLSPEQKDALWYALLLNYQPENRTYLYNFVFDNCATRPYHLIRQAIGDSLQSDYPGWCGQSYRTYLSHYTGPWSWADFGINLLFGPKADQPMNDQQRLFLPEELMKWMEQSGYVAESRIGDFEIQPVAWWATWPFGMVLAMGLIALMSYRYRGRRAMRILDITCGVLYLVVLLIVAYLTWFSLHPLVGFGWRLWILPSAYIVARIGTYKL